MNAFRTVAAFGFSPFFTVKHRSFYQAVGTTTIGIGIAGGGRRIEEQFSHIFRIDWGISTDNLLKYGGCCIIALHNGLFIFL